MERKGNPLSAVASFALSLYVIGIVATFPYHSWRQAREREFPGWLFLGNISAVGQSLVWPYYLIAGHSK